MKIQKEQYDEICRLFDRGHSRREIADMYGVGVRVIEHIIKYYYIGYESIPNFTEEWEAATKRVMKGLRLNASDVKGN